MSTSTEHREDIYESAETFTDRHRAGRASEEGDVDLLDVEVFVSRSDSERRIAHFTLAIGGPTVTVEVDERDNVTFFNSWGMNSVGEDRTEIALYGDDSDFWVEYADEYAEIGS
jgi:hypothetical protein